jgi:hypothetical protein
MSQKKLNRKSSKSHMDLKSQKNNNNNNNEDRNSGVSTHHIIAPTHHVDNLYAPLYTSTPTKISKSNNEETKIALPSPLLPPNSSLNHSAPLFGLTSSHPSAEDLYDSARLSVKNIEKLIEKIQQLNSRYNFSMWNVICKNLREILDMPFQTILSIPVTEEAQNLLSEVEIYFQERLFLLSNGIQIRRSVYNEQVKYQYEIYGAFNKFFGITLSKPEGLNQARFEYLQFFWINNFGFNKQKVSTGEFNNALYTCLKAYSPVPHLFKGLPNMSSALIDEDKDGFVSHAEYFQFGSRFGPFDERCMNKMKGVCDIYGKPSAWYQPTQDRNAVELFLKRKENSPIRVVIRSGKNRCDHVLTLSIIEIAADGSEIVKHSVISLSDDNYYHCQGYSTKHDTLYNLIKSILIILKYNDQIRYMDGPIEKYTFFKICKSVKEGKTDVDAQRDRESPVSVSFVNNSLYDEHLIGEIFKFI